VRSLGCDEVIDYTAQEISEAHGGFDAGFDVIGGKTLEKMFEIMKPGTKIVSIAGSSGTANCDQGPWWPPSSCRRVLVISYGIRSRARRSGVSYRYLFMHPSGTDLAELAELIEQGKLKVIVDKAYPLRTFPGLYSMSKVNAPKGKSLLR